MRFVRAIILLAVICSWLSSRAHACLSGQRILQGGPLPIASNEDRLIVGGEYFFPSGDAPKHELRSTVLIYSVENRSLKVFRSNETKELPKHVTAVAISKDTAFVNGQTGVIARHGADDRWRTLPGLEGKGVTALAWDGKKLWVGTTSDLSIYDGGRIAKSFSAEKYFDGFGIISIIPVGDKIFIGTHMPPPVHAGKSSSLDDCGRQWKGRETEESFRGAAFVSDLNGDIFAKVDPNGVFDSGTKPKVLFDVYPSTMVGHLVLAAGDGLDTSVNGLSSEAVGIGARLVPSGMFIGKYNPFLALIAKTGKENGERQASVVADFLEQAWELLPLNAKLWAFDAQYSLWARNGQWQRFTHLDGAKRLWAASFLTVNPDPKAQHALVTMIKESGASVGVLQRVDHGAGAEVDAMLFSILKGNIKFATDRATADKNDRDPERVCYAALRSLRMRLGVGAAPRLLALLKSKTKLLDEVDKNIRQALYDLAPGKWILQQAVISGNLPMGGSVSGGLNTPTGPYVTLKDTPDRMIREAYLSLYKPNGDFNITLALPLKGTYVLHYGKARAKSRSFSTERAPIDLGHLDY